MARKRQIDPEFCVDEDMAGISRDARLYYILLWTQAEDTGALEYKPTTLKVKIFPYDDDVSIPKLTMELILKEKLIPYADQDDKIYLFIKNFSKHQIIQHYSIPRLPLPPEPYRKMIPEKALENAKKELLSHTTHILLNDQYNRIELSRIELSRVEIKKQPYWAAFKESTQEQMKAVSKGFNIYQFLTKLKKDKKIEIPEEVINRICASYVKNKAGIKEAWPWFIVTTQKEWEKYNAEKNILEGEQHKRESVAPAILEILKGMAIGNFNKK